MISPAGYLALEALVVLVLVIGVHALRRKTSLAYTFAVVAGLRIGSWATTHDSMVSVGWLHLNVGSNVFFSATLLGVFLLYVADGQKAGRIGVGVVVGTGVFYTLASMALHAQFPDRTATIFPDSGLRANLGSIVASLIDLIVLGVVWEAGPRGFPRISLFLRVFSTLAAVFVVDALVYVPVAWAGGAGFSAELGGNLIGRLIVAVACAPFVTLYLAYEVRRHGLLVGRRPMLSILLREDAERELLSAQHQLRLGTEALWESEERYRRMVDDIPIMVFRFSVEGLVTYANRPLCAYYGRELKEVLGMHVLTPVDEAERPELWRRVAGLTPGAPSMEFTAHATPSRGKLAGQRRVQRWVVRGIFSPRGGGLAFQAVGEDVTDRVVAERALVRLSAAIDQASECVAITDASGTIEFVNPAFERSTGYSRGELLGRPASAFLSDLRLGGTRAELIEAIGRREGWTGRLPVTVKRQPTREFRATVTPIRDEASKVGGYVAMAEDISREVELEGKLLQAQRMEAVGRMAGGVAHDFNNLIAVIWTCAEAASRSLPGLPPEVAAPLTADLVDIRKSADRAALLTRQLLTLSRQEAIQPRRLDVSEVVKNLATLLGRLLPAEISLDLRCASPLPQVQMDPLQLERVIVNLVSNARDAMPKGGPLTVSTAVATLDHGYVAAHPEARPGAHVVLTVTDEGTGMDADTCRQIFEPFFTTKQPTRGTGLGLSTVYGIVQQAGGHLRVESKIGAGTTFSVYFPVSETQTATPEAPARSAGAAPAARPVILYCESEEDVRTQVVQLLGNEGYRIVCARDAAETLAYLREQPSLLPGVLLTDMVTSGMTGIDLGAAVRALRPHLPVAILTGAAPDPKHRDGADGRWYVDKRYWRSALLAAIDAAVRSRSPAQGIG